MNRNFDYTEQIENYLEGKMSGEEMKAFEARLQKDPALKSEFHLQQDIINTIKDYRKAALKSRLDNVNVGSYGSSMVGLKVAITAALTVAVGLGIYFYSQEQSLEEEKNELALRDEKIVETEEEIPSPSIIEDSILTEEKLEEATEKGSVEQGERQSEANTSALNTTEAEQSPEAKAPQLIEDFGDETVTDTEVEIPESDLVGEVSEEEITALEIENTDDNKHTFHYKFYNSKLYLYGDFKNIPYEIIELNTVSGKSLYLYYQGSFYYLETNQMEVTPLQKIKDDGLIEELDSLRVSN